MWEGYLNAITEFIAKHDDLSASVVIDRFHVAQQYRNNFDQLRKQERKRLKKELPPEIYDRDCKGMLWILRKNNATLKPEDRLALRALFAHSPALHQAYTFREELTAIFNLDLSPEQAQARLSAWVKKVERSGLDTFDGFIKTLRKHWHYIITYFQDRISSGFVEGLNNKIKTIKRRCYGLRKVSSLFQRIWLDLHGPDHFSLSTT